MGLMSVTRTACSYCGVGCGIQVETAADADSGRPVIARVSGDKLHPANFGRLCTKGATHAEMMAADDGRLKSALLRPTRDDAPVPTPVDDAVAEAGRRLRAIIDEHGPDAVALYVSGQMSIEAQYLATKLAKGFVRTVHIESNSRLCMASAGTGYKQSLGADGPPGLIRRLRLRRFVFRHRLEHGRLPSHPVSADGRPAQGGCEADRCRPASHHHRRHAPTCSCRSNPAPTWRCLTACCTCSSKTGTSTPNSSPSTPRAGMSCPRSSPTTRRTESRRSPASRNPTFAPPPAMIAEAGEWMSCWTMGLNQSTHGTWNTNAICNLHLATGAICRPGSGPMSLTGQPNAMGGREMGYMGPGLPGQRSVLSARGPRVRRDRSGACEPGTIRSEVGPGTIDMFEQLADGDIKACWIICTNPVATVANRKTVITGLEAAELVITQDAYRTTATNHYADIVLPATLWAESDAVMVNSERNLTLLAAVHPACRPVSAGLAADLPGRRAHGLRRAFQLRVQRADLRRDPPVRQPEDRLRPARRQLRAASADAAAVAVPARRRQRPSSDPLPQRRRQPGLARRRKRPPPAAGVPDSVTARGILRPPAHGCS